MNLVLNEEIIGYNDDILEIKYLSKDFLAICSNSDTIRIVDKKTKLSKMLFGHRDIITACDVRPNSHMVTGSRDGRILLWQIQDSKSPEQIPGETVESKPKAPTIKLLKKYKGHLSDVVMLSIGQKTGKVFISCGGDGMLKSWDISKQTCKTVKPHKKEINFCRINRNEKFVITGSHDRTINLYHARSLKVIRELKVHSRGVWDGDFAPFELMFATGSSDMTIRVWDLATILKSYKSGKNAVSNSKELSQVSSQQDQSESLNLISNPLALEGLTSDQQQNLLVKNVLNSTQANSLISSTLAQSLAASTQATASPDCLWVLEGHESPIVRVKWLNLGLQIISGDSEGVIKLWNPRKGLCLFSVHKHQGKVWSMAVYEDFLFNNCDLKKQRSDQIEILTGDNNSCLYLWKDNTISSELKKVEDRQERKLLHSQLQIHLTSNEYGQAVRMCFDKDMNSWFFKTLQQWSRDTCDLPPTRHILFGYDEYCDQIKHQAMKDKMTNNGTQNGGRSSQSGMLQFAHQNQNSEPSTEMVRIIEQLYSENPGKLLSLCRSFVTHSKYTDASQMVLQILFANCIELEKTAELSDQLATEKIDFKSLISTCISFSEKHLRRKEIQRRTLATLMFGLKRKMLLK